VKSNDFSLALNNFKKWIYLVVVSSPSYLKYQFLHNSKLAVCLRHVFEFKKLD